MESEKSPCLNCENLSSCGIFGHCKKLSDFLEKRYSKTKSNA